MDGVPPPSADAGGYSETAATDGDPAGVPPPAAEGCYPAMAGVPPPAAEGGYPETDATDGDPAGVSPPAAEGGYPDTVGESEGPAASLGDAG